MVLDAIEAGSKGQTVDNTFLDTIATRNRELFQTKKKELDLVISNTLSTLPGGANAPFIKTGVFRREMYQLNKALNQALVNADSGTIKLINEILEQTAGKKAPGKPGIAPAKELTFQQAMATLNGLNRLIDDDYARLAGGAADSNTITKVAAVSDISNPGLLGALLNNLFIASLLYCFLRLDKSVNALFNFK